MKALIIFLFLMLFQQSYSQWENCSNGLRDPQTTTYYVNVIANMGGILMAGKETSGLYFSTNNGDNWFQAKDLRLGYWPIFSIAVKKNSIFVGSKGLFYSTDSGENWSAVAGFDNVWVYSLFASGDTILAGTGCGVFLSKDNGSNWIKIKDTHAHKVAMIDNHIFVGKKDSYYTKEPDGLFVSSDGGESWAEDTLFKDLPITDIFIEGNDIYVGYGDRDEPGGCGVYYSNDNGNIWSKIYSSPKNYVAVNCIIAVGNKIFIANTIGGEEVLLSTNNGISWEVKREGLEKGDRPRGSVYDFAVKDNYIFVATYGGVYRALLDDFTSVENGGTEQDYNIFPNPARNMARLKLPEGGAPLEASFFIYNPLGVKVKEIQAVRRLQAFGQLTIEFDVSDLPPGIYFLTLRTEAGAVTKQFAVVR